MSRVYRQTTSQYGLTLVELMIAMVVSLLLLAGVIQIFLSSKQSYQLQDGLSRLQENGRFAMDVVTLNLRHAGYKTNGLAGDDLAFPADATAYPPASVSFSAASQVVVGTEDNTGADFILNGTDTLTFRFRGTGNAVPAPLADCLGATPVPAGTMIVNTLYVRDDPATAVMERELHCRAGTDQPLLDGVENMQILYGVDTNGDRIANKYRTAANIAASNEWTRVVSVRVALLLSTVQGVTSDLDTAQYTLLNNTVDPVDDRLRRHVFTTTIALRNLLP